MEKRSFNLASYRRKTAWVRKYGASRGEELNREAEAHFANVERTYRELLGQIADGLVSALSAVLDDVVAALRPSQAGSGRAGFRRLARHGPRSGSAARTGQGSGWRRDFGTSSSMNFRTPTGCRPPLSSRSLRRWLATRWQDARLRKGSLFLVGDPKQAIYRFRGADIKAYNEARATIAAQTDGAVVEITANFRSQEEIIEHVNHCFEPVLQSEGQPGYVRLTATLDPAEHGLPPAAKSHGCAAQGSVRR